MPVNIKDISLVANIRVVPKFSYSYGFSLFVKIMTLYYHISIGNILTIVEKDIIFYNRRRFRMKMLTLILFLFKTNNYHMTYVTGKHVIFKYNDIVFTV